jgi:hypothetical protein
MEHVAKCHCGSVSIACDGEPSPVIICHCKLCQRRTGTLFQVAAWFDRDSVRINGKTKEYTRTEGDAHFAFTFNFCINCGTSIWWLPPNPDGPLQGKIGVAGGCFSEPGFPCPSMSIYHKSKHDCVMLPPHIQTHETGL